MTKEEKFNLLNELLEYEEKNDIGLLTRAERREFQQWISEALEQEPTTKNDLGVDCISRTDAIKGLGEQPYVWTDSDFEIQQLEDWKAHKEMLENLPSVTPQEPRKGHWIDTNNHQYYNDGDIETTELRCSCCNEEVEWDIELLHKPYFCENCGADMREVKE